jgi:hypothetical protein
MRVMQSVSRSLVIDVGKNLPPRARPVTDNQLQDVFGGCAHHLESCRVNMECCSGSCIGTGPNQVGRCYR